MDSGRAVMLDSSVLINFLIAERLDLLAADPTTWYLLTNHVDDEITDAHPEQRAALEAALQTGIVEITELREQRELAAFVELVLEGRLGQGECAAIAAAGVRGLELAIDDRKARRVARRCFPALVFVDSVDVLVRAIQARKLDVGEADEILAAWRKRRFECGLSSIRERLARPFD